MDAQCRILHLGRNRPCRVLFMACGAGATVLGHRARYTWYLSVHVCIRDIICDITYVYI